MISLLSRRLLIFCVLLHLVILSQGQNNMTGFKEFRSSGINGKPIKYYELLCTKGGSLFALTTQGLLEFSGTKVLTQTGPAGAIYETKNSNLSLCEGVGNNVFSITPDNSISCTFYDRMVNLENAVDSALSEKNKITFCKLWVDKEGSLFIGTQKDGFIFIKRGADQSAFPYELGKIDRFDFAKERARKLKDSKKVSLGPNVSVLCFSEDSRDTSIVWVGGNSGLFTYNKVTGELKTLLHYPSDSLIITNLEVTHSGDVWFSTIENGMILFNAETKKIQFFNHPTAANNSSQKYPIKTFCRKSSNEFFVAVLDSLPAIFNTDNYDYKFLDDTVFRKSKNTTSDIKFDAFGNLFVINGGVVYYTTKFKDSRSYAAVKIDSSAYGPYVESAQIGNVEYSAFSGNFLYPGYIKEIKLNYDQHPMHFIYSLIHFDDRDVQYAFKMEGLDERWSVSPFQSLRDLDSITYPFMPPGRYVFRLRARLGKEDWRPREASLTIIVEPPYWQAWWFWALVSLSLTVLIVTGVWFRTRTIRKQERLRARYERQALELEAKALRAQMNPHFIFNCLNSIKALIQQGELDKSVNYLTTFSKLIRAIFHNSDKREISFFDEIETCRLYAQLETMRFGSKLKVQFDIDKTIDLKSLRVPALIIQPFIENAIWHGIMPKEDGGNLSVTIKRVGENICCNIDDDGIGRDMSRQIKFKKGLSDHQSKGVHLTQSRIDLDNLLNERNARLEIIDKKDPLGKSTGTSVSLTFKENI
jgi:hypothetical protein